MTKKLPPLPYTICFCVQGTDVLMVHRKKKPNADKDNGLGGKRDFGIKNEVDTKVLTFDENPNKANEREIWEEAGIGLKEAVSVRFAGVISWAPISNLATHTGGMYAYTAELKPKQRTWESKETPEGTLEWQPQARVCDLANTTVVSNIPYFLPHMLIADKPHLYEISYVEHEAVGMKISELPEAFSP